MADEDNFDIYGDDNFVDQGDDIYSEIVGGDDDRPTKRAKADGTTDFDYKGDEDLFEDFGDLDKEMGGTTESVTETKPDIGVNSGDRPSSQSNPQSQTYPVKRDGTIGHTPGSRMNVPNATTALYIAELNWWTSDEDIRQFCAESGHDPSEVKEVTFYEHKVNGKSRGVAYAEFNSIEAAASTKEVLENKDISGKTPVVNFTSGHNPFKTIPKEPPPKSQRMGQGAGAASGMSGRGNRGGASVQQPFQNQAMRGAFNPMMPRGAFGTMPTMAFPGAGGMPMNPYAFSGGRGAGGYMGGFAGGDVQMGGMVAMGRGGMTMPRGAGRGMRGGQTYPGMHINPAFFDQQQAYGMDDSMGSARAGVKRGRMEDDQDGRY